MPACTLCHKPLDRAAILNACSTCTDCAMAAIRRSRAGTHANVTAAIAARNAGQRQASDAHPDDRARVDAAIRQLAALGEPFSANDCREIHGVTGPVVGAAFTAARKAGLIRAVGFVASTDPGTHAHPVRTWVGITSRKAVA